MKSCPQHLLDLQYFLLIQEAHMAANPSITQVSISVSDSSISPRSEVNNAARSFIPREIPSCSWDCGRDIVYSLCSTGFSVIFGIGAGQSESTTGKAFCGTISAISGLFVAAMLAYGITIRCCPSTQRFWSRVKC